MTKFKKKHEDDASIYTRHKQAAKVIFYVALIPKYHETGK